MYESFRITRSLDQGSHTNTAVLQAPVCVILQFLLVLVLIAFSAAHYMHSTGTAGNSLNGSSTFAFLAGFSVAGAEPGVSGDRRLPRFFCEITMRPRVGSRDGHHLQTGCRIRASCKRRINAMSICVIMNRNLRVKDTYLAMISSCFFFSSSSYEIAVIVSDIVRCIRKDCADLL